MTRFDAARRVLLEAITTRVFPAAVVEIGTSQGSIWREALGTLTYEPGAPPASEETIFDLASLTKVAASACVAIDAVQRHALALDDTVGRWLPEWQATDRAMVTIRDLLRHSSGLPDWRPLYETCRGQTGFRAAIAAADLRYPPCSASIYSDLGFMVLGFVLEHATGRRLDAAFADLATVLKFEGLRFNPPPEWKDRTAPTGVDPWRGRLLVGEVHDENAAALDGVAGHAGLFGPVAPLGRFAQLLLRPGRGSRLDPEIVTEFTARSPVPGSSRALGWDTMLPTSSCGTRMSPRAFGHTGFTGTSLWIDPEADIYVALLTNRVHPSRNNDAIRLLRRAFHDAVFDGLNR